MGTFRGRDSLQLLPLPLVVAQEVPVLAGVHVLVDLQQEPLAELKRLTGRERGQDGAGGQWSFYGASVTAMVTQGRGTPVLPAGTVLSAATHIPGTGRKWATPPSGLHPTDRTWIQITAVLQLRKPESNSHKKRCAFGQVHPSPVCKLVAERDPVLLYQHLQARKDGSQTFGRTSHLCFD